MRGEVWVLLSVGLAKYVRLHARNLPALPSGIQEDLVAEKAADLIQRIDRGSWDLARAETGSIAAMLSSAARNGIVDYLRKEAVRGGARNQRDQPVRELEAPREERAMDTLLGREYGRALADCILGLEPRARLIWVLGVFHGFSSKRIGGHPEVSRTPQAVDMAAHRSRKRVRDCMEGKGFDVDRMPSGSFVTVWEALNLDHRSGGSPSEVV